MGSVDLPYLWLPLKRGKPAAYYRRGGLVHRIRGPNGTPLLPGEPGFLDAYQALHQAAEDAKAKHDAARSAPLAGSLAALVVAFRSSEEWQELAPTTRKDYGRAFKEFEGRFGRVPVSAINRAFVFRLRDEYARDKTTGDRTPRRGNRMVDVLRLLLSFAVNRGWRRDNPALRPGRLKTGPGYATWSENDFARFMACAAVSEPIKRAAALGYYTGQRLSDCLTLTLTARQGGAIELIQQKTGARVWIPEHPELARVLDAAPPAPATTLLTRADGQPWKPDHFKHAFTCAVRAAGLSGLSFHGLRKAAAARLAEAGASAPEIQAITGHRTLGEVTRYTAAADQRGRARAAITKLAERTKNPE